MMRRRAFTLIEMLTVLAITAVLLTLIIVPVIQTFNLLRHGQGFADAQEKGRVLIEKITREMSNAAAIRDNSGAKGVLNIRVPGEDGTLEMVALQFAKIDLLKPAEGDPSLREAGTGAYWNPNTGRYDPTLRSPKGQVVLPVAPGTTIVRYFIGLRDPIAQGPNLSTPGNTDDDYGLYNNPHDGLLMRPNALRDNLFVLYRVEVEPYNNDGTVNAQYFFDLNRDNNPDTFGPWFDDPDFFNAWIPLPGYSVGSPGDADKETIIRNWLRRATVVTELSRYDMILPLFDKRTRGVIYDANVPRILPLVQFRPTTIGSEPTTGQTAVRQSEEGDTMGSFAPDVFRTKYGSWSSLFVRVWPTGWSPSAQSTYMVGRTNPANGHFTIFGFDPNVGGANEATDGNPLFDSDIYAEAVRTNSAFPFSQAIAPYSGNLTGGIRDLFVPLAVDAAAGKMMSSFSISEVGTNNARPDLFPTQGTGPAAGPNNGAFGGNWDDPVYSPSNAAYEINTSFNKIWREQLVTGGPINYGLLPNIHRFIDLRVHRMSDGTVSPLHPDSALGFSRSQIVPGSEEVFGPDQSPGTNFGNLVRYVRVTKNPGPNQYKINYTDQPEPRDPGTGALDYSLIGLPNPPANYTASNFVSAIIQPRYKSGYLQFQSDPNVPLPQGNIIVRYRFQLNRIGDVFSADYDSRQLMSVLLTVRNYPQTNFPNPQQITLEGSATIRNVLR